VGLVIWSRGQRSPTTEGEGGGWRENTGSNRATVANRQRTQAITGQLLPTDREHRL
jgi:hypothetical protein